MPAFALRFVGREGLPSRLSEFDREQFFELAPADIEAIREQFRGDHRLPAALMVMFMRVAGRPLDGFNVLPRNLLRHTAQALGVSPPSIASLRSIYKRRQTLYKHQLWAKTYLGLRDLGPADESDLTGALHVHAEEASHPDDLVQSACHWLFARRILIPGARRLQDWARDAFAAVEAQILEVVNAAVPPARVQQLMDSAYHTRPGTDVSQLEWLRAPPKRHGPTTLSETLEKVRYLSRGARMGRQRCRAGQAAGVRSPGSDAPPGQDAPDQGDAPDDRTHLFPPRHAAGAHGYRAPTIQPAEPATVPRGRRPSAGPSHPWHDGAPTASGKGQGDPARRNEDLARPCARGTATARRPGPVRRRKLRIAGSHGPG